MSEKRIKKGFYLRRSRKQRVIQPSQKHAWQQLIAKLKKGESVVTKEDYERLEQNMLESGQREIEAMEQAMTYVVRS